MSQVNSVVVKIILTQNPQISFSSLISRALYCADGTRPSGPRLRGTNIMLARWSRCREAGVPCRRCWLGHSKSGTISRNGWFHGKPERTLFPTTGDSVLLLLLSSILVGWSDWLTNIGGWIVGGLGLSPVVVWSPGIGSDRELFTLPCDTRAFLYAPEFVRYDRTGGPGIFCGKFWVAKFYENLS